MNKTNFVTFLKWFTLAVVVMLDVLLLTGCAGTLTLRLPDGATLTSSRDTTIGSIHVERASNGAYRVDLSNYTGSASQPMDAQSRMIKTVADSIIQASGTAAGTAAAAALGRK